VIEGHDGQKILQADNQAGSASTSTSETCSKGLRKLMQKVL